MAGAGYKLFNTGDVLTAQQVNEYLMQQAVMVFADASARTTALSGVLAEGMISYLKDTNAVERYDGSTWSAIGAGDIEGVTAGTGISGGGTSGTVTITNSMATAIDAKGDLVAGTGADTFARLAVGANDTVLTADSSTATGLKWAAAASSGTAWSIVNSGGTSMSGSNTVTVSGITGADKLMVLMSGASSGTSGQDVYLRFNSDTGSNYNSFGYQLESFSTYTKAIFTQRNEPSQTMVRISTFASNTNSEMSGSLYLTGGNATNHKMYQSVFGASNGGGDNNYLKSLGGYYTGSSTISSVSITLQTGSATFTGGTLYVYKSA